jgi:hypothetical protein
MIASCLVPIYYSDNIYLTAMQPIVVLHEIAWHQFSGQMRVQKCIVNPLQHSPSGLVAYVSPHLFSNFAIIFKNLFQGIH